MRSVGVAARLRQAEIIVEDVGGQRRVRGRGTVGYRVMRAGVVVVAVAAAVRVAAALARRARRTVLLLRGLMVLRWRLVGVSIVMGPVRRRGCGPLVGPRVPVVCGVR